MKNALVQESCLCYTSTLSGAFLIHMGGFPSGQRGQTVNLLQIASVVRIHLRPLSFVRWTLCLAGKTYKCRRGGTGRRAGLKILS